MNQKIIKSTPHGSVAIIWDSSTRLPRVIRLLLSTPETTAEHRTETLYPDARDISCSEIDGLGDEIRHFLEGGAVGFSLELVDLARCGTFQRQVLRAEHRIPRGAVSTYGLIAERVGKPRGARAVGNALARNPFPLIVPCHRAIRSDGHLSGFQGGTEMKRALLAKEGIMFDKAGRVKGVRFHYGQESRRCPGIESSR